MVEEASRRNFSGRLSFYLTKPGFYDRLLGGYPEPSTPTLIEVKGKG